MNATPYLFFNNNCRQAFEFYAQSLGAEITAMLSTTDTPMGADAPAEARDLIMHACLDFQGTRLMASDWNCGPNPTPYEAPRGFRVALGFDSVAQARQAFEAMAVGGHIDMPLEKTFFAAAFGMLTDKFGMPWMFNCDEDA